ncbi:MAG: transcriptional repressor [Bacteroidaceae bacterium]
MEKKNLKEAVKKILTEYLETHGHRKTPERFAILEAIYSIKGHFGIDTLYNLMLNEEKFRVSRATLYNTIILFMDAKLVIKHQFGGSSQYEKSYNMETHHHLICTSCGRVSEVHDEKLETLIGDTKFQRFQMSHYSLYIYGICSKCAAAKRRIQKQNKKK